MKRKLLSICFLLVIALSVSAKMSSINYQQATPYEMMTRVFVGSPSEKEIRTYLEPVMKKHNLSITKDNLIRCSSSLLSLRKSSKKGITEMQILKHMYKNGSSKISFADQAGISATLLELK